MRHVLSALVLFCLSLPLICGWIPDKNRQPPLSASKPEGDSASPTSSEETCFVYTSEVVGAHGRIGSFWLCHDGNQVPSAVAVPRGLAPGCLTNPGCPIYVATPGAAWQEIWDQTLEARREDLVFVGNGIPPNPFENSTFVIPHFSILKKCRLDNPASTLQTNAQSPKTYVYGKHATRTARILNMYGVATEMVVSFTKLQELALQKLLWASCMWLLCHAPAANGGHALTVGEVIEQNQAGLDRLVDDLHPALQNLLGHDVDRANLDAYLRDYSLSIAGATPSLSLALAELDDRNGVFLKQQNEDDQQIVHKKLLRSVIGEENYNTLFSCEVSQGDGQANTAKTELKSIGLSFLGKLCPSPLSKPKKAVVVGGGIIGTCIALSLKELRPDLDVTVLDKLPPGHVGRTTPASWAWLNANGKSPKTYQSLNQLGIRVWKTERNLASLVTWSGSLVRFEEPPDFVLDGGYPSEGPLNISQILQLEPHANWQVSGNNDNIQDEGFTYYFRDEGLVDPSVAVAKLRQAAKDLGVVIIEGAEAKHVQRDKKTKDISGVVASLLDKSSLQIPADLVIVAAGAGSGAKGLGCGFDLLSRPGAIAYAKPGPDATKRLSRILVDPARSSHVLQRADGTIVAGGGPLEVGGSVGTVGASSGDNGRRPSLLDGATKLAPGVLRNSLFSHVHEAVRPMPLDGLPIIGYIEPGLYAVVTHSGVTLGPLLAKMAAAEIMEDLDLELLRPYRPTRFNGTA